MGIRDPSANSLNVQLPTDSATSGKNGDLSRLLTGPSWKWDTILDASIGTVSSSSRILKSHCATSPAMPVAQNVDLPASRSMKSSEMACKMPATSPRVILHSCEGAHSINFVLGFFVSSVGQNKTRPSADVVAKKSQDSALATSPPRLTLTGPSHLTSVTGRTCDMAASDSCLGRHTGGPTAPAPSPPFERRIWYAIISSPMSRVSQITIRPSAKPPAMMSDRSGLNANECTSTGASSTYWGLIGSVKCHTSTEPGLAWPPASTRSSNECGSTHDTASASLSLGFQSTHDAFLPLLWVRDEKDMVSLISSVPPSSAASSSSSNWPNSSSSSS
mmetsp:Transcript_2945/g.13276  ORF Transcript_2945/g.13276 Transcript_2945/m.13276 type:complete len:332 (-) Transcript_2945:319-1314(-)